MNTTNSLDGYLIGEEGFEEFLEEVLNLGGLSSTAEGITKLVLDKGVEALTFKQRHVFKLEVLDQYAVVECSRCETELPWSEQIYTSDNGGLCSWCDKMNSSDE